MKFIVHRVWGYDKKEVSINTIEDLKKLYEEYGKYQLIIDFDEAEIEIYDDYIE